MQQHAATRSRPSHGSAPRNPSEPALHTLNIAFSNIPCSPPNPRTPGIGPRYDPCENPSLTSPHLPLPDACNYDFPIHVYARPAAVEKS
jgi:hypothetical protein